MFWLFYWMCFFVIGMKFVIVDSKVDLFVLDGFMIMIKEVCDMFSVLCKLNVFKLMIRLLSVSIMLFLEIKNSKGCKG